MRRILLSDEKIMEPKPLKEYQLITLAVVSLGIQFVGSLQMTNMSSIYKFLGASSGILPFLGLAAPICGLLVQPIVGQLSDDTYSPYGKRRPYLFCWSIIAAISCLVLPFTSALWLAVILMWLISFSTNGAIEALRALTGDIVNNKQKSRAFSWQTVLAGIGAVIAAEIPYAIAKFYPQGNGTTLNSLPLPLKITFILSAFVMLATMYWTLTRIKERIPTHRELLEKTKRERHKTFSAKVLSIFKKLLKSILHMPAIIRQLGLIQIFTWIGLYAMWLFFSLAISQHLYGLKPGADISNPQFATLLERGTMKTNYLFGIYQFFSVICALMLPFFSKFLSEKTLHGICLIIGASGLFLLTTTHSAILLIFSMFLVGIMWGSIMTLPFAIIAEELPSKKMGVYFGLFNISITLPQILAGFLLQPMFVYIFHNNAVNVIRLSSILILTGGLITVYWFALKTKISMTRKK